MEHKKLRQEIEELKRLLHDRLREPEDVDDAWARHLLEYSLERRLRLMDRAEDNERPKGDTLQNIHLDPRSICAR